MRSGAQVDAPPVYGVTIDNPWNTTRTVQALTQFGRPVTARIVFDDQESAAAYDGVVQPLAAAASLVGEISDSGALPVDVWARRVDDFYGRWGSQIAIWEICNECNGEWLIDTPDVVTEMTYAYDAAKARGFTTVLTLYYDEGCVDDPNHEMFQWTTANVPARMRQDLDFVLVSYWEDDCRGLQPSWQPIFDQLGAMFPNSRIGFGEIGQEGTHTDAQKEAYLRRYYGYGQQIQNPQFVGGYFYWWFSEDMVPSSRYLWGVQNDLWQSSGG